MDEPSSDDAAAPNTLEMMNSMLEWAQSMEQKRPGLYRETPSPDMVMSSAIARRQSISDDNISKKQGAQANPKFYIQTPGDSDSGSGRQNIEQSRGASAQQLYIKGNSIGQASTTSKSLRTPRRPVGMVTVEFYDEYVGFGNKQSEETSQNNLASHKTAGKEKLADRRSKGDDETAKGKNKKDGNDSDSWEQIKYCHYIREDLNTSELTIPNDYVQFVFGKGEPPAADGKNKGAVL